MFFAVALSMGHLTTRLRTREIAERRRQMETDALLRVTQSAALAAETDKGFAEALRIINSVIGADTALGRARAGSLVAWHCPSREHLAASGSGIRRRRLGLCEQTGRRPLHRHAARNRQPPGFRCRRPPRSWACWACGSRVRTTRWISSGGRRSRRLPCNSRWCWKRSTSSTRWPRPNCSTNPSGSGAIC